MESLLQTQEIKIQQQLHFLQMEHINGTKKQEVQIITDSEDNIVAVGGFASNLRIGTETINAPTTNYSSSIMIKFSSATGEYVSSKVFGGTNNDDKIMTATATEDGGVLLGGWFYSKDFDIDGDGTNDVCFYTTSSQPNVGSVTYVKLASDGSGPSLSEGNYGNLLCYSWIDRTWNENRDYLYPVPRQEITLSDGVVTQNPGWNE